MNKPKKNLWAENMSKSKSLPDFVLRVRSYDQLEQFARAFAEGHLNLLMICGDPGTGKTRCIRCAVGAEAFWIDGNASAFGLYIQAYQKRHRPIVLDDVDQLYRDRNGVRLLKGLCQSEKVKNLCWLTHAPALDHLRIPREFTTTSRVAIIANRWKSLNADVAALEDRGHFLHFAPTALEVHDQAASWFWDQEIFDFVGDHLNLFGCHSLRTYVLASEAKRAGLDWRETVLSRCMTGAALEVAKLKANPALKTEEERVRAFITSGLGCRATYFNYAKKIQSNEGRPEIHLLSSTPPSEFEPGPNVLDKSRHLIGTVNGS